MTIFHDQVGLYVEVPFVAGGGRAQAALVELVTDGLADTLVGQVTHDAWVVRAVLQGGFFPGPAAVGGKIAAGVVILGNVAGFASAEREGQREDGETREHDGFSGCTSCVNVQSQLGGYAVSAFCTASCNASLRSLIVPWLPASALAFQIGWPLPPSYKSMYTTSTCSV
ncbi:hypothetical protein D3C76_947260 [compost metagenome]